MDEYDDLLFDPRLFWAEKNSEDLGFIMIEKKMFEFDLKLLEELKKGEKSLLELAEFFKVPPRKIRNHLRRLRLKKVPIEMEASKIHSQQNVYRVLDSPHLKFNYSIWKKPG